MTPQEAALRAIEALPHPILVVDGADRLVLANAALWKEAGADPARFPPGTALRDLLRLLAFQGMLGPGDPAALAEQALARDRTVRHVSHLRSADGARLSEAVGIPLAGGGFALCAVDITPLRQARLAADHRAVLLEHVLNAQHGGVALFDAAERLVLHNAAYRRHLGVRAETLAGRPGLRAILEGQQRAGAFLDADDHEYLRGAVEADRRKPRTVQRMRADGSVIRFASTPQPDGGFLIEADDVTDLRRAEDEARRRAAILDGVLEALPHGICVWGPDRRVALFNASYLRLMEGAPLAVGDTLEEVIRRRAEAGEYGPGEAAGIYAREMARDISRLQERRRLRANGMALDVRTAPLPDGGHVSVVTDITALWRAEEELRQRAAMQQVMLETMGHGICLFDAEGRVLAANALAARLTGLPPGAFRPGRHIWELRAEQVAAGEFAEDWRPASMPAASAEKRQLRAPDRYVRRNAAGSAIEVATDRTPDGGYVRTYTDVTEDHRIREELERARTAAEAASEAKSRFLATMSHELRTPLSSVIGYAEALLGGVDPAQVADYAGQVRDAGRQLLGLIDGILEVARAGGPEDRDALAPVDPAAVVATMAAALRGTAEAAQLAFEAEAAPGLPRLLCDERRLRRILRVLLDNAVKFTPMGGRVRLAAAPDGEGGVAFAVSDTGIGMAEADIPRAFEAFTQLDASAARRFPGSGLGLHLARLLAGTMGATLALDSTPGQGTIATLRLPRGVTISDAAATQETT